LIGRKASSERKKNSTKVSIPIHERGEKSIPYRCGARSTRNLGKNLRQNRKTNFEKGIKWIGEEPTKKIEEGMNLRKSAQAS